MEEACINESPTVAPPEKRKSITFKEYISGWQSLTFIDALLVILCGCLIIGIIILWSAGNEATLTEVGHSLIRIAIVSIISFITITSINTKFLGDICLTCQGQNQMEYKRKVDVVMSFLWAIIVTFIALILQVAYIFVVLHVTYILLRGHLLFRFDVDKNFKDSENRLLIRGHDMIANNDEPSYAILKIIYKIFIGLAIATLIASIVYKTISSIQQAAESKDNPSSQQKPSTFGRTVGFIGLILMPFIFIAVTQFLSWLPTKKQGQFVDNAIAKRVLPLFSSDLLSPFNFMNTQNFEVHATVFLSALAIAFIFAMIFLKPMADVCTPEGNIDNENTRFLDFKNRFLMGHYVIGILIVLLYMILFGGPSAKTIILVALLSSVGLYLITNMIGKSAEDDNDDPES